eukprot:TRINITY_DN4756_c0_g2_i3.p1 TRINITY_DN4756_c0_g2~~TRINITY_DN4756_c0_g2_i3.p1  ORF type:complete len:222 (-),score=38.55 TRINITY_DN4756_c0_g2_i3:29-694(-)
MCIRDRLKTILQRERDEGSRRVGNCSLKEMAEDRKSMTRLNSQLEEDDQELSTIEELSQKLENLYRDMEQIRRENMLFESYLLRNSKDALKEDDGDDQRKKRQKKDRGEKKLLTAEEKYEIANFESEALKRNIDEGRIKSDTILETLRAILEETDMAITEIRKDAFDFQREILIGRTLFRVYYLSFASLRLDGVILTVARRINFDETRLNLVRAVRGCQRV